MLGGARLASALAFALVLVAGERSAAEEDGIDSTLYNNGTVGCGSPTLGETEGCHADPESDLVQVVIEGPSAIEDGGGAGFFTASAMTTIAEQKGSGINVLIDSAATTSDCRLDTFPTAENDQLVVEGPVLSHQDATIGPPLGSFGVYSYSFLLIDCNTPGTVRLLVAMNTFNFDGDSTGDAWNQAAKTVTVPEPSGAALAAAVALAGVARGRRRRTGSSSFLPRGLPRAKRGPAMLAERS